MDEPVPSPRLITFSILVDGAECEVAAIRQEGPRIPESLYPQILEQVAEKLRRPKITLAGESHWMVAVCGVCGAEFGFSLADLRGGLAACPCGRFRFPKADLVEANG